MITPQIKSSYHNNVIGVVPLAVARSSSAPELSAIEVCAPVSDNNGIRSLAACAESARDAIFKWRPDFEFGLFVRFSPPNISNKIAKKIGAWGMISKREPIIIPVNRHCNWHFESDSDALNLLGYMNCSGVNLSDLIDTAFGFGGVFVAIEPEAKGLIAKDRLPSCLDDILELSLNKSLIVLLPIIPFDDPEATIFLFGSKENVADLWESSRLR